MHTYGKYRTNGRSNDTNWNSQRGCYRIQRLYICVNRLPFLQHGSHCYLITSPRLPYPLVFLVPTWSQRTKARTKQPVFEAPNSSITLRTQRELKCGMRSGCQNPARSIVRHEREKDKDSRQKILISHSTLQRRYQFKAKKAFDLSRRSSQRLLCAPLGAFVSLKSRCERGCHCSICRKGRWVLFSGNGAKNTSKEIGSRLGSD